MQAASAVLVLFSVLVPSRLWYAPNMPLEVSVKAPGPVTLVLTDFTGKALEPRAPADVEANAQVDLKTLYPLLSVSGTYVLWATPRNKTLNDFIGTPLVISVRTDPRTRTGQAMVTRVEPLRYGVITTEKGPITVVFYYDVAPHTADTIQRLAEQGFYDGLAWHRIVPGFVIQGGDPRGDGTGGPGFRLPAEFSDKKHVPGVLSMARESDPLEPQMKPRADFRDTAGSQFFICLARNQNLDGRYTAFGEVAEGMEAVKALAATPLADEKIGKPVKAPLIQKFEIRTVTPGNNPYRKLLNFPEAAKESRP